MDTDADASQSLPELGKEECERPSEEMEVEYSESTVHGPVSAVSSRRIVSLLRAVFS